MNICEQVTNNLDKNKTKCVNFFISDFYFPSLQITMYFQPPNLNGKEKCFACGSEAVGLASHFSLLML